MIRLLLLAAVFLVPATSLAEKLPTETWIKAGVSYEQYHSDSLFCAKRGYYRDISGDEPARRFLRGFRSADDALNRPGDADPSEWVMSVRRTQPDRQLKRLLAIQQADVEACLVDKQYTKITLSRDQERVLSRYPIGSEDRRHYLHSLSLTSN